MGSPWRMPRCGLKKVERLPFQRTLVVTDVTHPMANRISSGGNPTSHRTPSIKDHWIMSYALAKSTLIAKKPHLTSHLAHRMEHFLGNHDILVYAPSWHKPSLKRGDEPWDEALQSIHHNLREDFVTHITQRYRSELIHKLRFGHLRDQTNVSLVNLAYHRRVLPG